jgi:membrane-bound lytic murein transglycosylase MltF
MNNNNKTIILLAIWIILLSVAFILSKSKHIVNLNAFTDWETIQKKGYIRAGILQNTTDYYVENGTIKGFHHDLMEFFGKDFNLKVHYAVYNTYWDYFWALMTNEIDLLAMDINNNLPSAVFFLYNDSLHWAVNKQNTSLYMTLNSWLESLKKTRPYPTLFDKYYSPTSKNRMTLKRHHQKISANSISFLYDDLIKKYAQKYDFDWRFVAAIAYHESGFKHNVTGKGGSYGLMQIMPRTAAGLGMKNPYSAENQILYGCKYLNKLKIKYTEKGVDSTDLYKFTLAAYNAGNCRIDDARLVTEMKGLNPNKWQNIEKILPKLSDKKFTKNIPLNCGNYNGKFTQNYVSKVWKTYQHYQNMAE